MQRRILEPRTRGSEISLFVRTRPRPRAKCNSGRHMGLEANRRTEDDCLESSCAGCSRSECRLVPEQPRRALGRERSVDSSLLAWCTLGCDGCLVDWLARKHRTKFSQAIAWLNLDPIKPLFCHDSLVNVGEQDRFAFVFRQYYFHCLPHSFFTADLRQEKCRVFCEQLSSDFLLAFSRSRPATCLCSVHFSASHDLGKIASLYLMLLGDFPVIPGPKVGSR